MADVGDRVFICDAVREPDRHYQWLPEVEKAAKRVPGVSSALHDHGAVRARRRRTSA